MADFEGGKPVAKLNSGDVTGSTDSEIRFAGTGR